MSYTIEGTNARSTTAYVTTEEQLSERLGSDYTEGEEHRRVLVLENPGNQFALVIGGETADILNMLDQARDAVVAGVVPEPMPEILVGLVADGEPYYTTEQMRELFTVEGFAAPYVLVRRKIDGQAGTLMFTHAPRYYFGFHAGQ